MSFTLTIPTLETERLILRAPTQADGAVLRAFLGSERAQYIGGPYTDEPAQHRIFRATIGLWVLRGYGLFTLALKSDPDTSIGAAGPYHPEEWPEPEFSWFIYDPNCEGKGYVTEAMRTLAPWSYAHTGYDSFVSYIDEDNAGSINVATALGAQRDEAAEAEQNTEGALFYDPDMPLRVYRHQPAEYFK